MAQRVVLMAALLILCVPLAQAQYGRRHDERVYSEQAPQPPRPGRPGQQRERGRNDGDRRALTPDEQRDLRRDLQRANQEIYRKGKARKQDR